MQRSSSVTLPFSTSSVAGRPRAKAAFTGTSSMPSSASRAPSALVWTPMRWRADTALGEAYSTRAVESSSRTPSPTRGASSLATSSTGKGNSPLVIMRAKRSKIST